MKRPRTTQVEAYRAPLPLASMPFEGAIPTPIREIPLGNARRDSFPLRRMEGFEAFFPIDQDPLQFQTYYQKYKILRLWSKI